MSHKPKAETNLLYMGLKLTRPQSRMSCTCHLHTATKTSGRKWSEEEVEKLLNLWAEETIQISIDNAKTPKEKTAVYQTLKVQLEQQGEVTNFKLIII